jgi:hypothetical protein
MARSIKTRSLWRVRVVLAMAGRYRADQELIYEPVAFRLASYARAVRTRLPSKLSVAMAAITRSQIGPTITAETTTMSRASTIKMPPTTSRVVLSFPTATVRAHRGLGVSAVGFTNPR